MKLIEENTALANMSQKTDKMDQKEEDSGRVGRLEEHTMGYYRRVSDKIQEGFENEEEKGEILIFYFYFFFAFI